MSRAHTLATLALLSCLLPVLGQAQVSFTRQPFALPLATQQLVTADLDGDGRQDLIAALEDRLRLYLQTDRGFDFDTGFQDIEFGAQAVGWDLSRRLDGSGRLAIVALIDGREVLAWTAEAGTMGAPRTLLSGLSGYLGKGVNRLHLARDINADGRDDLIVPGAEELLVHLNRDSDTDTQTFDAPLHIQSDFRVRTNLRATRLEGRTGQAIEIPRMELEDLNGDGRADLVSRTDERLAVFLADGDTTNYFPLQPSYELDIAAIEAGLGGFDFDNLDFSNLTGVLALTHEEILDDVNNDGIADLLLREGSKVSLFAGTGTDMNYDEPLQVLRSGGNVLSTFLYDENEDGLKDLWLWRVEPVSVGDIFVWLALSGSIAIEAFIYPNEGERFARRPTRRITIDLKFPSVIRLATSLGDIADEVRSSRESAGTPSARGDVDGLDVRQDLLVLMQDRLALFLNAIEPVTEQSTFLGDLGYSRARNDYEIDIRRIIDSIDPGTDAGLDAVRDRVADLSIPLESPVTNGDVLLTRLNGDSLDDVFIFTGEDGSHIRGLLLLSNQGAAN